MEEIKQRPSKPVKMILLTLIVMGLMATNVFATTASADITGAEYSISNGKLVITGTNFGATIGTLNDIDPTKIVIGDSKSNLYMLTSSTKKVDITDATSITIVLGSKDQVAVAKVLNKGNGKVALNGGTYKLYVMNGWNGKNSKSDFTGVEINVANDLPVLESAAYDYSKGELILTGANFLSITGAANDIIPKYLAITDFSTFMYFISPASKMVEVTGSTSATVVLGTKDKEELEYFINQNGTKTKAGADYKLIAFGGWNGPTSLANASGVGITVSQWALPVVSLGATQPTSITIGATVKAKMTKAGTLYLVAKGTSITDKESLDTLSAGVTAVTITEAVKMAVTKANTEVGISTVKLSLPKDDQVEYLVYGADRAGQITSTDAITVTIKQKTAGIVSGTLKAAVGTAIGTAKIVTTGATIGTGNKLAVLATSTSITGTSIPLLYSDLPSNATKDYTGGNISGVSATSVKYVGIYEYDPSNSNRVVKFKQVILTAKEIAKTGTTTGDNGDTGDTEITITGPVEDYNLSVITNTLARLGMVGRHIVSDNEAVAIGVIQTADVAGIELIGIQAGNPGTTKLTVSTDYGRKAIIDVTVAEDSHITYKITKQIFTPKTTSIKMNKATLGFIGGNASIYHLDKYVNLLPSSVANSRCIVTATSTEIMENGTYVECLDITSNDIGTTTIKVESVTGYITTIPITVAPSGKLTVGAINRANTFQSKTESYLNNKFYLGLVGTSTASSNANVATATIDNGYVKISSKGEGTATITVSDSQAHNATIPVTVEADGTVLVTTTDIQNYQDAVDWLARITNDAFTEKLDGTVDNTKAAIDQKILSFALRAISSDPEINVYDIQISSSTYNTTTKTWVGKFIITKNTGSMRPGSVNTATDASNRTIVVSWQ